MDVSTTAVLLLWREKIAMKKENKRRSGKGKKGEKWKSQAGVFF